MADEALFTQHSTAAAARPIPAFEAIELPVPTRATTAEKTDHPGRLTKLVMTSRRNSTTGACTGGAMARPPGRWIHR